MNYQRRPVVSVRVAALATLALLMSLMSSFGMARAQQTPADGLAQLRLHLDAASVALADGDAATARAEYAAFSDGWFDVEDGVRAQSRPSYRAIEAAMNDVMVALAADPLDATATSAAFDALWRQCDTFITG